MSDELESLKLSGKLENSENATRKSEEIKNRPIFGTISRFYKSARKIYTFAGTRVVILS